MVDLNLKTGADDRIRTGDLLFTKPRPNVQTTYLRGHVSSKETQPPAARKGSERGQDFAVVNA